MAPKTKTELDTYAEKRDPAQTTEPFSPSPHRKGPTRNGQFVVHLHDASRRHYDLRLEMGGVLLSFAVPKGPSMRPLDKRLAVQTENHPLLYLDFEDVIPEGNYGAGAMICWDRGRVRYEETTAEEGLDGGEIKFELSGYKLRGRFTLVRTSDNKKARKKLGKTEQPLWLLIKKNDQHSDADLDIVVDSPLSVLSGLGIHELAEARAIAERIEARAVELGARKGQLEGRRISPMLCSSDGGNLELADWFYELKLDGVRILADKRADDVILTYRTARAATANYPEIARAVRALPAERVLLDGEIVAFDDQGKPDFQLLARRIQARRPSDVQYAVVAVPVVYLVFDILGIGNRDLRKLPLRERKSLLADLVRGKGLVRTLDHIEDGGQALYDFCAAQGLEGVVGKRARSRYVEGPERTPHWVKFKCERDAEFVIVGWTVGRDSRERLGAFDLASYEGDELVIRGKVGSGLDQKTIDVLVPKLKELAVKKPRATGNWGDAPRGRTYVKPELVASIRYLGWSHEGSLRFPVFRGIRPDVDPRDVTTAPPIDDDAIMSIPPPPPEAGKPDTRVAGRRRVPLTNQNKVFWPDEGYTKGDLCEYYDRIAPAMLPHLAERPIMLVRYPDGIRGKNFYQWRIPQGTPDWIRAYPVRSEEHDGKETTTFIADDVDTLLHIANLGCIPIHVLASQVDDLERSNWITIDFDVGNAALRDAIELARELRGILEEIGLRGYPKTSGQTGLHVFVPMGPGVAWETAKMLCELLGRILASRHHEIATMQRNRSRRGRKVYVDTGQTGRSRTIVAPWSVRAAPGATVSTPLTWDEVSFALDPRTFTVFTVPERYEELGDPWAGMLDATPDVPAAVQKLYPLLPR